MNHFVVWLFEQDYRSDLVGELAQLAKRHPGWPLVDDELCFRVFLHLENASVLVHRAFKMAHSEWKASGHLPPINVMSTKHKLTLQLC